MNLDDRKRAVADVTRIWAEVEDRAHWIRGDELLIRDDGTVMRDEFMRLLHERDQRPVLLNE